MWIIKNKRNFLLQVYILTLFAILAVLIFQTLLSPSYKIIPFAALLVFLSAGLMGVAKNYRVELLAHSYVICFYVTLLVNMSFTGGLEAPGATWFLICPLISLLTLPSGVARFWVAAVALTLILFYLFEDVLVTDSFNGQRYWYLISYLLFFLTTYRIIGILYEKVRSRNEKLIQLNEELRLKQEHLIVSQNEIVKQHEDLKMAECAAVNKNKKLEGHLNQMLEITRMEELHNGNLSYSIQTLQAELLKTLELDSVGFWHFDEVEKELKLISSASNANKRTYEPASLKKENAPEIFELLEAGTILRICDKGSEKDELKTRLGRGDFKSMIGCPYFIEGRFAGFISCKTGRNEKWSPEDVIFVRAISDALSLSFKSHQRKQQHSELEKKQHLIEQLNESLEEKVTQRTAELKVKNDQLTGFAFINAHKIRGPVCRLLGLNNLLLKATDHQELMLIKGYLSESVKELDEITRNATKLLTDNNLISEN